MKRKILVLCLVLALLLPVGVYATLTLLSVPGDITILAPPPPPPAKSIAIFSDAECTQPIVKFWLGTETQAGSTFAVTVYVKNTGGAQQVVAPTLTNATWGSMNGTQVSLAPGASGEMTLNFNISPTAAGHFDNFSIDFVEP